MSQFNYPNTAATASRLLKRFGAACQVLHPGAAVYNPDTGTVEPTITTTASTAAVFAYAQKYVDGTLIKQGDQQAFCDPAVAIVQGDSIVWQSVTYQVVSVKPVSPAGTPVLYEAQLRA